MNTSAFVGCLRASGFLPLARVGLLYAADLPESRKQVETMVCSTEWKGEDDGGDDGKQVGGAQSAGF